MAIVTSPSNVSNIIRSYSPDLIVKSLSKDFITLNDVDKLLEFSKNIDSLIIGCGIGLEDETGEALNQLLDKIRKPMVIDADALKLIDVDLIRKIRSDTVLTPHGNEFKELFSINIPDKLEDKIQTVLKASESCDATVLMKGSVDIIASNDRLKLNCTGNPGMTVGGTGDCLAGLVGGLLAQGHEGFEAAFLGAYINGKAGDLAILDYGYNFTTSDLLKFIPDSYK